MFSRKNKCTDIHRFTSSLVTQVATEVLPLDIEVDLSISSWNRRVSCTCEIYIPPTGKVCENEIAKKYLLRVNGLYISEKMLANGMTVIAFQGPCPLLGYAHKRNHMYLLIGDFVVQIGCHKHKKRWTLHKVITLLREGVLER